MTGIYAQIASDMKADVQRRVLEADRKSAVEGLKIAKKWSSGTYTTAMLAKMDHPYAKRHGAPQLDPSEINKQTGLFYEDWRLKAGARVPTIWNVAPYAIFLQQGTWKMFARLILGRIKNELTPIRLANYKAAFDGTVNKR